jgi:hypothetical protein
MLIRVDTGSARQRNKAEKNRRLCWLGVGYECLDQRRCPLLSFK